MEKNYKSNEFLDLRSKKPKNYFILFLNLRESWTFRAPWREFSIKFCLKNEICITFCWLCAMNFKFCDTWVEEEIYFEVNFEIYDIHEN